MVSSPKAVRRWYVVHKWTSLISTLFILVACITGLPLIFHEEIEGAFDTKNRQLLVGEQSLLDFDQIAKAAEDARPNLVTQFIAREDSEPGVTLVSMGETIDAPLEVGEVLRIDNITGEHVGSLRIYEGFMGFIAQAHIELFAGMSGTLFLGFVSFIFLFSIISGVLLYSPFMRRRAFAVIRIEGSRKARWFDLHNALGMILMAWVLVVSVTGIINTLGAPIIQYWLMTDMKAEVANDIEAPVDQTAPLASLQSAYEQSLKELPGTDFFFVMYPGTNFSSDRHYIIFNRGQAALSSRLFQPAIINAYSGEFISAPDFPWYIKTFLLSQPLHFGDYGGLPLKIAWALLDMATIILLWSGLILWWRKRRHVPEIEVMET